MKNYKNWLGLGLAAVAVAVAAHAAVITYNAYLVNTSALAYNSSYVIDLQNNGIGTLSAQAIYSSATIPSQSFGDGATSAGSLTVADNTKLTAVSAHNTITVLDNAGSAGVTLVLPGTVLVNGIDWATLDVSSNTAESIAAALRTIPGLQVSHPAGSSVVYATAPAAGTYYNSWALTSSSPTAVATGANYFFGGQDNISVSVNGVVLQQGFAWNKGAAASNSATAIANAINANPTLNKIVTATPSSSNVNLRSKFANVNAFPLKTSLSGGISVSAATMTGGVAPAFALGGHTIRIPAHGFTLALPLLYGSGTISLGGLTGQTTYYAIPVDADTLALASSQDNALTGTYLSFTSTTTQNTADSATFSALPIAGTPSFKWQVSNDGNLWSDLAVSSVTVNSYTPGGANTIWSFGYIGLRYLRLNVVAPTAGGLKLSTQLIGTP